MADEEKQTESGEKAKGTPWLLVIGAALVAMLVGAGAAYVAFKPSEDPAPIEQDESAESAGPEAAAQGATAFQERLFTLDPFVVNVTGDGYSRYLKVALGLEAENDGVKQELDARTAQIRDAVIVLLSSRQLADITDYEGKSLLKEDILMRTNDLLESGEVKSVLFTEFVVQ